MGYLWIGCLAFGLLYLFDYNKIRHIHRTLSALFPVGVLLILYATVGLVFSGDAAFILPPPVRALSAIAAACFFCLMIYALFFALPFRQTYLAGDHGKPSVIDSGIYALCRHPGVIGFIGLYLFLWLGFGKTQLFWAALLWGLMDILHVYVQDRYFFPKTLAGYDDYKKTTPFLVPNRSSVRKALSPADDSPN